MANESYVSSMSNTTQQVHLNAVIKSFNQYIDAYKEEETKQHYTLIDYTGLPSNFEPKGNPKDDVYFVGNSAKYSFIVGRLSTNGIYNRCDLTFKRCHYTKDHTGCYEDTNQDLPYRDQEVERKCIVDRSINEDGSILEFKGERIVCYCIIPYTGRRLYNVYVFCLGTDTVDVSNAQVSIYRKYLS